MPIYWTIEPFARGNAKAIGIEIDRQSLADPKEIRRQRAARAQQAQRADQATSGRIDVRSKH